MEKEAIKDFLSINGEIIKVENTDIFEKIVKPPVYEVIRVIEGVPLFLEEHLERMEKSFQIAKYHINRTEEEIKKDIENIILKNRVENLNIKLLCAPIEGEGQVFLAYFIESYYPESEVYEEGIHTILYYYEREKPNAKILNTSFKERVNNKLKNNDAFEALLVNKNGRITEGSRSNMFFIKGDKVYTAPRGEVLLGITRKHILNICNELNLKLIEENIHVEDLVKIDGAFMTGTSVNVLPITTIEKQRLDSVNNFVIKTISSKYMEEVKKYIKSKK